MFERDQEVLVKLLLLAAGLVLEALALLDRVILLGVGGCDFLAVDASLKNFNRAGVLG